MEAFVCVLIRRLEVHESSQEISPTVNYEPSCGCMNHFVGL